MQVTEIERHLDDMAQLSLSLGGCLSEREARFLSLAAATLPPSLGEVLASDGPLRTFREKALLSSSFGPCRICGSIGWAQYLGSSPNGKAYASRKIAIYRKLSRLIQFVVLDHTPAESNPLGWRILRPLVPHGSVNASEWQATIAKNLPVG